MSDDDKRARRDLDYPSLTEQMDELEAVIPELKTLLNNYDGDLESKEYDDLLTDLKLAYARLQSCKERLKASLS